MRDKVQITVFYETFCPYSVDFFVEQLEPAVLKLGSYLDLQLVPYGKAQVWINMSIKSLEAMSQNCSQEQLFFGKTSIQVKL